VKLEGNNAKTTLTSICMPVAIPKVVLTVWARLPHRDLTSLAETAR
jgi:hypothetical protein